MSPAPPRQTRSTCPYCGVGCGVIIESVGAQITGVRGDPAHPANRGRLCSKGATLHETASATLAQQVRLLQPLQRTQRGAAPAAITWEAALDAAANGLARIVETHGPDAVGVYVSGQLLTEDYYVFNKLVKGLLGSNQIDTNSRLCMSSAVAGYKQTLGADAPPACYDDIAHARCLFISGSNTAWAHPVLFRRIEEARQANPKLRIVVVDPRRTDTAEAADLHLPLQPGTDVLLCHGLLHIMLWEGWTDPAYIAAHTQGFEALRTLVRDATPQRVAEVCGLKVDDLITAARWFAGVPDGATLPLAPEQRQPTLSLYCQGLNQSSSGTAKNTALINLHLATGQIGKPGAGPFSLTGQPNAMGGREVGGLANLLSAHRDLANPAHRAEVAALWGVPEVPATPGRTAVEMFQAAADGAVKALWIACTNPAQSLPDQAMVRRALQRAELVIVQEAFASAATCAYADLLLPASTWGEKEGTVTNSERCISRVRAAVPPPQAAGVVDATAGPSADWAIAAAVGQRIEARWRRGAQPRVAPSVPDLFAWATPEAVWNEHRESTRGRDLDITGLSYALLDAAPRQWPFPAGASEGRARLYGDGVFPTTDGRARFIADAWRPVAEPRDARYPFSLITGRLRDQWHGLTRTGTLGRLWGHVPEPTVQMHPQDMARRGLAEGDLVHVTSRRGTLVLPVQASTSLGSGQVFVAMHWGSEVLGGSTRVGEAMAGINALTLPALCPASRQPELKHAAVKVLKAELPWTLLAMAWLPETEAQRVRQALLAECAGFAFASCVPFGRERCGVQLRAAALEAPPDAVLARIEALLGLAPKAGAGSGADMGASDTLRYLDRRKGQRRAMRLVADGANRRLEALLLAGDTRAESWVRTLLQDELPAQAYGRALLAPGSQAPVAVVPAARQVCTCLNVRADAIEAALADCPGSNDTRLAALQATLRCGTQCGSCVPELRRLIRVVPAPVAA